MRKLIALAPLALAGACHFAPPHAQVPLPTPPVYLSASDSDAAVGIRATDITWREFFRDPRLQALIATAMRSNRDMMIAVEQIEVARGQYRIQNADRIPSVVGSVSGSRSSAGVAATGIPGSGTVTTDRLSVGVSVPSFELDFWGRVRDLSESARARYLATVQAQRAFRLTLIQDVATTYFQWLEAQQQIQLAEQTVQSRREGVRIAQVRLNSGLTSALDFHQAESLLTQAEAALASLRLQSAQIDNLLFVLVGGPLPSPLPAPLPLSEQLSTMTLAAGLPSELLLSRPDVIGAEERLRAAEANVGAARAAFFPVISLTGALGFASDALSHLVGTDGMTWNYGASAASPIFNRGRLHGNVDVARAEDRIAIADYERTIQGAFQEVSNALAGRRFLAEQVAAEERGTQAQRQIAALAHTRYLEGVVSYIEVLDAERTLFAAQQQLLQLRRVEASNLVSLYIALGGGARDTVSAPAPR